jgi:DNA-binding MarR family transcriptional regulator
MPSRTSTAAVTTEIGLAALLARRCSTAFDSAIENALARERLTAAQFATLRAIYHARGKPQTSAELARALDTTPQAMVGLVHALQAKGYLTRTHNAGLGRAIPLALTPTGRAACADAQRKVRALERKLASDMPGGNFQHLPELLRHLSDALDQLPTHAHRQRTRRRTAAR